MLDGTKDKRHARKGTGRPVEMRSRAPHHKTPADSSGGSEDEQLAPPLPAANNVAICEIVEVISRDLSPPQSDLSPHCSGSEASSDVSAIAEDIVNRVMGTPRQGGSDTHPLGPDIQKTTVEGGERGEETEKAGVGKTVRFSLAASPTGSTRETGEADGGTVSHAEELETVREDGSKVTLCSNGTRKTVSGDGKSVTLEFQNGDTKHIGPDSTVVCLLYPYPGPPLIAGCVSLGLLLLPVSDHSHHIP